MMPRPLEQHSSGPDRNETPASSGRPHVGFGLQPRDRAGEPAEIALRDVSLRIEDRLLMAFGPDGDPLPPTVFSAAAAREPAVELRLADGRPVAPLRAAAVLEAQIKGALAEADGWIEAMLGLGPQPAMASAAELQDEQQRCELTAFGRELMISVPTGGPFLIVEAAPTAAAPAGLVLADGEVLAVGRLIERLRAGGPRPLDADRLAECTIQAANDAILLQLPLLGAVRLVELGAAAAAGARVSIFLANGQPAAVADLLAALGRPAAPGEGAADPGAEAAPAADAMSMSFDLPAALTAAADGSVDLGALHAASARCQAQLASVTLAGLPIAARLSAGLRHDDGSWRLTAEDLPGLQLQMPPEAGDFTLEITLHALQGTETRSLAVRRPPAEEPAVPAPVMAPAAPHDAPLRLAVRPPLAPGVDPRAIALVMIDGLPEGAELSAGIGNADGRWMLSPEDLVGLELIAPAGLPTELVLRVTTIAVTSREGELASAVAELRVPLGAAAPLAVALAPAPGFDALLVRDLPAGARLSAGTYDPAIDGWVLLPRQLVGLTLTPAPGQGPFTLTVLGVAVAASGRPQLLTRLPLTPA